MPDPSPAHHLTTSPAHHLTCSPPHLLISVVPEPSTWLMLAFAGVIMMVFRKRRAFSKNA